MMRKVLIFLLTIFLASCASKHEKQIIIISNDTGNIITKKKEQLRKDFEEFLQKSKEIQRRGGVK